MSNAGLPTQDEIEEAVDALSDEQLHTIAQNSVAWTAPAQSQSQSQVGAYTPTVGGSSPYSRKVDEDGFPIRAQSASSLREDISNFAQLQLDCWAKFVANPQINTHVRDYMGYLTGFGFKVESQIPELQDKIDEIVEDPRNALTSKLTQYVARSEIEGELFLALSLHTDGFVEVDFMDPSLLTGGGENNSGIYFHPDKSGFPLVYEFHPATTTTASRSKTGVTTSALKSGKVKATKGPIYVPSINLAHYPELRPLALSLLPAGAKLYGSSKQKPYKSLGKLSTFIITWDKGFLTNRNVSHIKTTINWIDHYENLKFWEIDHKKSAGAYLWVVSITDAKAYRTWLKLTKQEKQETGLFAKKTPGGTIVLPPGIELSCKNPSLSSISGQDTDIMQMITSGLNASSDIVNGADGKSNSSLMASRGPQSDRTQDQIAYFERFLRYELWRSIFLLCVRSGKLKEMYSVREAVGFNEQKPKFRTVKKPAFKMIDFEFPTSEISDVEGKARAYLGVKHGSVSEQLGIPKEIIAKKLGFSSYYKRRLQFATEEEVFPKTLLQIQIDSAVESGSAAEPGNNPKKQSTTVGNEKSKDNAGNTDESLDKNNAPAPEGESENSPPQES